jgi:serine/threonine protein kinase/Flp pilus assembly protein TadD
MTSETHKSLDQIVREARSLAPEDQVSFIREACATDQSLYESVTREVASSPGWADLSASPSLATEETEQPDAIGERIGPYRILRMLGEGGMGAVFFAERDDGQFHQEVAIKLVRRGLLSRNVQNRLRIERQILATLDHPNIAKLLDGGTTVDGTPYIVMEYIDGEPIDIYCDRNALTTEQRLRLFCKVCSAVYSAHQNLVVHRDLKPSNILVTRSGIPKLLDFGIAKLLDERQLMQTLAVTHADVRLMTPDHASPEQVRGDPITTASDVYVLAILLYELLTGLKPFARATHRLADLERAICEQEPTPPGAALVPSAKVPESELSEIAAKRGTNLTRLRRELRGDLDNIVLMGLRKEPERRYSSVEQFAADIDRHLQGLPVNARADAWTYRTSKFVRRHFIVVGLTTAFVLSLIGFSITTYVQSIKIEEERDVAAHQRSIAEVQREHAESISSFMVELFKLSDPSEARGNEVRAREILDRGAVRVRNELKDQPELQASLMETIGRVYLSLGLTSEAQPLIEQSLQIRRELFGNEHLSIASSLTWLAAAHRSKGEWGRAQKTAEDALSIYRRLSGEGSLDVALGLRNLGMVHYDRSELDLAEQLLRESLNIYVDRLGNDNKELTTVLDMLGRVAQARGNFAEAEQLLTRALQIERKASGDDHPLAIERLHNLATVFWSKGDLDTAERQFREAIALYERVLGTDHSDTADAISNLASVLQRKNKLDEAKQAYEKSLAINRKGRGARHFAVAYDLSRLGIVALAQKLPSEAELYLREALDIYRDALPPGHPHTAAALTTLGRALIELNKPVAAEIPLKEALSIWANQYGLESAEHAVANSALAQSWILRQERLDEAEQVFRQTFAILRRTRGPQAEATLRVQAWLQRLYDAQDRSDEATEYFASFTAQSEPESSLH